MTSTETMVRIRYASRVPGAGLAKKLFGYKEWKTKVGNSVYSHKPIQAALAGIPFERLPRGGLLVPEQHLAQVRSVIEKSGGVIKSIEAIVWDRNVSRRRAMKIFEAFGDQIDSYLQLASKATTKEVYTSALTKAVATTRSFEVFIGHMDEYGSVRRDSQLRATLIGLRALADQDLESAKAQVAFFIEDFKEARSDSEVHRVLAPG